MDPEFLTSDDPVNCTSITRQYDRRYIMDSTFLRLWPRGAKRLMGRPASRLIESEAKNARKRQEKDWVRCE